MRRAPSATLTPTSPEREKRTGWLLGHRSVDADAAAPHKLNLKVGFGDIVILRIRTPKSPGPTPPAQKKEGLMNKEVGN